MVFLSQQCTACATWLPLLNAIHLLPDSPQVIGVMALRAADLEVFIATRRIRFPLAAMDETVFGTLVSSVPTFVLLHEGVIAERRVNQLPAVCVDQVKYAAVQLLHARSTPQAGAPVSQ